MTKCSDFVVDYLRRAGVTAVFELSGGMITHLLDSLHREGSIRLVGVHHEQAAAFAADAYGRMSGIPGVAMATSGPGATNLLTGIGSCYFDSSPAVFITGQVNRDEQKRDRPVRQLGFQETDIVAMATPVTKAAWLAQSAEEVPALLNKAFATAVAERRGPVLLDLPMDVQRGCIPDIIATPAPHVAPSRATIDGHWDKILSLIRQSKRPMILAGGGIQAAGAVRAFREVVDRLGIPIVHSLMGVDVLPWGHRLRVGMIGTYGNRWANVALMRSDFLLVLGSRLDVRQTGSQVDAFKMGREIVHVDCDPGEINNRIKGCIPVVCDVGALLRVGAEPLRGSPCPDYGEWSGWIDSLRCRWPDEKELSGIQGINPNVLMHALSQASGVASAFAVDVGQHQMWAAQSLELGEDQRFLTSGGMGSMGFALPAAIGVACAAPGRPVVVIAGDGGFQCNIQELETVKRNGFPVKIVLVNNNCHGMVRQFQQSYFEGRHPGTVWGYSAPDFQRVAEAYGLAARTVHAAGEVPSALSWLWNNPGEPALLNVMVDQSTNVYPKVAFGRSIGEMEPGITG